MLIKESILSLKRSVLFSLMVLWSAFFGISVLLSQADVIIFWMKLNHFIVIVLSFVYSIFFILVATSSSIQNLVIQNTKRNQFDEKVFYFTSFVSFAFSATTFFFEFTSKVGRSKFVWA
ncbi:conserved membrane hypothetical protein [Alteromonas sp. 38]|nr:conserved membrane hypothetical protein [Alteromonas sp. 154]VXB06008.1 conserved membrane hypothetical protein [Alteromonas sp. 38]